MANVTPGKALNRITSAFLAEISSRPSLRPNVWAEAGQTIETAHRSPPPTQWVARLLVVRWSAAMVKFLAR